MYKRILMAYDGSEAGQNALLECKDMMQWTGAALTLVAVMPHHIDFTSFAKKIEADLIVVGHKHLDSMTARWWRGSSSGALIEHAHCSVLVAITS